MKKYSLADFTDLIFHSSSGCISENDLYTLVRTPSNPYFYFGNYLILNKNIENYNKKELENFFTSEFSDEKRIGHIAFSWPYNKSENVDSYIEDGYHYEKSIAMTLEQSNLADLKCKNSDVHIRKFSEGDWDQWILFELDEFDNQYPIIDHQLFLLGLEKNYRSLIKADKGSWYGAFIDKELVASAGIFHEDSIGRLQKIRTRGNYQGKGICKTMLHKICSDYYELSKIVVVADENYFAKKVYTSLGFYEREKQVSLYKKTSS